MPERLEVKVRGGLLIAGKQTDPDNPGIWISYKPDGLDFEIDLAYVENTSKEDLPPNEEFHSEKDLRMFLYEDVYSEDYTQKCVIEDSEVKGMINSLLE